jgi:hypothetical protein
LKMIKKAMNNQLFKAAIGLDWFSIHSLDNDQYSITFLFDLQKYNFIRR